MAQDVLRKVTPGTHTFEKYIKPTELIQFFKTYSSPAPQTPDSQREPVSLAESIKTSARPWITCHSASNLPRTQAEVRGLIYNPLFGNWLLAPRDAWGTLECNYMFWVRKPKDIES